MKEEDSNINLKQKLDDEPLIRIFYDNKKDGDIKNQDSNIIKNEAFDSSKKVYNLINNSFDKTYNKLTNTKKKINEKVNNTLLMKKTKWIRKFILKLLSSRPLVKALIMYLIVIFIFAGLLSIKGVETNSFYYSDHNNFFYSFFTSLSTITAIGIMLNPIPDTYTIYGQVVLFFLLEFGGIIFSYIVSSVYLSFRMNKGNKMDNRVMIQIENGESDINSSLSMLKWNIVIIGGIQLVFALMLFCCIYYIPGYEPESSPINSQYYVGFTHQTVWQYHNVLGALWSGVFDSVSSLYNAGMTLFGDANASVYRNGLGIIIEALFGIEFILGGIGFPLFYDLILKIKMKKRNAKYKLSLYSKLSVNAVFYVTLISTILAYIFAYTDVEPTSIISATNYDNDNKLNTIYSPFGTSPMISKNWAIFFNMLNTHSAGFTSINLQNLSDGNKWVYIINMFIGCSPSATTGQIKLVILISTFYFLFKKVKFIKKNTILKSSITSAMVWNSLVMTLFGIGISIAGTIGFYFFYYSVPGEVDNTKILDSIFLGVSIYSLCGMSYNMSFTTSFNGQIILIFIILLSQMMILISIFVVKVNTYTPDQLRARRFKKLSKK